jgi:hypothetical protein
MMKKILVVFCSLFLLGTEVLWSQVDFDTYFVDKTMRIDYYHTGNATDEYISLDYIYNYGSWAGSLVNLIDPFKNGAYQFKIYDEATNTLIYSKGFDSYFKEYQYGSEANAGILKTFQESAIIPSPKKPIIFVLEKRDKMGVLFEVYRTSIDPEDINILQDQMSNPAIKVTQTINNGDPHKKADIVIVAEGYSAEDEEKYLADLMRFTAVFFQAEPTRSHKNDFNMYGVFMPSVNSGIDEPRAGIYKNTAVGASFNAMGSERYVLTENNKALHDIAGQVPYDAIYIMVNSDRYGGGGIYNFYCTFTSDNMWSQYLMIHEFGHSFFGLADEYYTSESVVEDFYPPGYEPVEPNITALLDPEHVKWGDLIAPDTPIPTPWEKAEYDTTDLAWQEVRRQMNNNTAALQKAHAPAAEIENAKVAYDEASLKRFQEVQEYLNKSKYMGIVGVYEGAGYASKGIYRSYINCIMFTRIEDFCPVCNRAMVDVIEWYAQ